MTTLWNQDEQATFAVNLGYLNVEKANALLARRDRELGIEAPFGVFLLEEGLINEKQYGMMQTLMGQPLAQMGGGDRDHQLYLEIKQAARRGDMDGAEKLLAQITDPTWHYRAQIQTVKAQHAKGQLDKAAGKDEE